MVVLLNLDGTVEKRPYRFFGAEVVKIPEVSDLDLVFLDSTLFDDEIKTAYLTQMVKHVTIRSYTKIGELEGIIVYKETP